MKLLPTMVTLVGILLARIESNVATAAVVALAAIAVLFLCWRRSVLQGTTLTHAWWWTVAALSSVALGEAMLAWASDGDNWPTWSAAVRLITATGTFCPVMAVLGARRPQHLAWQFIVITMWIMLALPAWEAIFLGRLEAMDVGPVRGWFLWLMLVVNLLTYLPTRFIVAAILTALGQLILLGPFLPGVGAQEPSAFAALAAMLFFAVAVARTACGFPRPRSTVIEFDQRWLQFRDLFGTMWALRVIERINSAARIYDWPMSLTWTGFYFHDEGQSWQTVSNEVEHQLRQTLENLLRRFVRSTCGKGEGEAPAEPN